MSEARPGEAFGCEVCWPSEAEAAYLASRGLSRVAELVDESHCHVTIRACEKCGLNFVSVFTETIDWSDGDDSQYWTLFPIEASEAADLISREGSVTEGAINALGKARKCLQHDHPKGKPTRTSWG